MSGPIWTLRTVANGWIVERHDDSGLVVISDQVSDSAHVFSHPGNLLAYLREEIGTRKESPVK